MADETTFACETLSGDIRDEVLREFKAMEKPWQQMTEDEQGRVIQRAEDIGDRLTRKAVEIVAARGLPALAITVGKFTVDGSEMKGQFESYADDDNLLRVRHLSGQRAMFVLASPDAYLGERKPAETENVGELAMPKTGPGAPSDPEALAQIGRGKRRKRGDEPPVAEPKRADVSDPPFAAPPDAMPDVPAVPSAA